MVMELLRGETLASHMDKKRRFGLEETLAIALPLLSSLAHAHAEGIVHRDLKPENVFLSVDPDGHVIPKILDFGISKLLEPSVPRITTDGAMLGTPNYMSPEQARGLPDVDARADVFAAGILLYECIAGENPFASGSYHSVVAAILERDPQPLTQVTPAVWAVIKRALEKPAPLRYADAGELLSALRTAAQTAGVQTPDGSGAFPARGSLGDRSVPPPFREQEPTIPSMFAADRKRGRLRRTIAGAVVATALPRGRWALCPLRPRPRQAATTVLRASAGPPAPSPRAVPLRRRRIAPAPAPSPSLRRCLTPPRLPPPAAASGRAAPPPRPALHPRASHAKPAVTAPAPAPPPKSTVVRDPGF